MSKRRLKVVVFAIRLDICILLIYLAPECVGHMYSYCAGGVEFSFSTDACPGGILLKSKTKIDKICQCEDTSLVVYSHCSPSAEPVKRVTNSSCGTGGDGRHAISWNGQALLLIPGTAKDDTPGPATCNVFHRSCGGEANRKIMKESARVDPPSFIAEDALIDADKYDSSWPTESVVAGDDEEMTDSRYTFFVEEPENEDTIPVHKTRLLHNMEPVAHESVAVEPISINSGPPVVTEKLKHEESPEEKATTMTPNSPKKEAQSGPTEPPSPTDETEDEEETQRWTRAEAIFKVDPEAEKRVGMLRHVTSIKAGQIPDPPPVSKTFRMLKESMKIVGKMIPNRVIKDVNLYEAYLGFLYLFQDIDEDIRTDRHLNIQDYKSIMLSLDLCLEHAIEIPFRTSGQPRQIRKMYLRNATSFLEVDPTIPTDRAHKSESEDVIIGIMWKVVDITHSACFDDFMRNSPSTQFDYLVSLEDIFLRPEVQSRWYENPDRGLDNSKTGIISHPDLNILMKNLDKIDAAVHLTSKFHDFLKKPIDMSAVQDARRRKKRHVEELKEFEIWNGQAYCLQLKDPFEKPSIKNIKPPLKLLCSSS